MEKIKYDGNQKVQWADVGWMPKEAQAPAKVLKLSEAIRIGGGQLREARYDYLNGTGCGCALAMAAVGYGVGKPFEYQNFHETFRLVSERSGQSIPFLREMENKHLNKEMSALDIADWLEGQGL